MPILVSEGDRIFTRPGGHSARGWGPLSGGKRGAGHCGRARLDDASLGEEENWAQGAGTGSSGGGAEQGPGPEICFFNLKPNNWPLLYRLTPGPLGTLGSSSPLRGQSKSSVASSPGQPFPGLDFALPLSLLPTKITSGLPPNRILLHTTGLAVFSGQGWGYKGPSRPARPLSAVN